MPPKANRINKTNINLQEMLLVHIPCTDYGEKTIHICHVDRVLVVF